jgi:predicted nucleic-acid-binding protein
LADQQRPASIRKQGLVSDALLLFEQTPADFADCLVSLGAKAAGCDAIVTFDIRSSKVLGMTFLKWLRLRTFKTAARGS